MMSYTEKGGKAMSGYNECGNNVGPGVGGIFTSTGVILVLFILLVIVSRTFI
ncbi:hypothetical protein D3C78_526600 [compost metagenome]